MKKLLFLVFLTITAFGRCDEVSDKYRHLRKVYVELIETDYARKEFKATSTELTMASNKVTQAVADCLDIPLQVVRENFKQCIEDCIAKGSRLEDPEEREVWVKLRDNYARNQKCEK